MKAVGFRTFHALPPATLIVAAGDISSTRRVEMQGILGKACNLKKVTKVAFLKRVASAQRTAVRMLL
jgi:hypothetical protein